MPTTPDDTTPGGTTTPSGTTTPNETTTPGTVGELGGEVVANGSVPDMLNGDDHFAYIIGFTDGSVQPLANITRAEVATIFFRLLKDDVRDENLTEDNTFTDVNPGDWYNVAISTMASLGIVKGRSAEIFDPTANITRAELAAICARFDDTPVETDPNAFSDISGHWAETEILRAAALGWVEGYPDGTFGPDRLITRAETVTVINRVLQRVPEVEDDLLSDMNTWWDNLDPEKWYYLAMQEATNSHDYQRKEITEESETTYQIYETWLTMDEDPDWTRYQN
jgi:hypothetical protein